METKNIFSEIPDEFRDELIDILQQNESFRLERIVSSGQVTPEGSWYDQEWNEWVLLLSGSASLKFEDEESEVFLYPGDYLFIPAHRKHRVTFTDRHNKTVWLALHCSG